MKIPFKSPLLIALVSCCAVSARADYYDDIGYNSLVAELQAAGAPVPNGAGVKVTQNEAPISTSGTTWAYLPAPNPAPIPNPFVGVTITNKSAIPYPGTFSWHAEAVGNFIYGNSSMGSGVTNVDLYEADDWIQGGMLNYNFTLGFSGTAPKTETSDVSNSSWVYSFINNYGPVVGSQVDKMILNRFDYGIQQDDYVAVVGINNNTPSQPGTPQNLLASAYNVISVGRTDGQHASGTSTTVNTGVTFPIVVAPVLTTSEATAMVSGESVFLISAARSGTGVVNNTSVNGDKSESIKAIIMAGATKSQFPGWSNTSTHPLDATYGAGQINVNNSYDILTAGEQAPSISPAALVANTGWDFNSINLSQTVSYYFDITYDKSISIALTWNAIYAPIAGDYNNMSLALANLDLYLYEVNAGVIGSLVASSVSTADNLEYIWSSSLAAGDYVMQVVYSGNTSGLGTSIDYGLAWQTIPEPSTYGLLAIAALVVGWRLRRRGQIA